MQQNPFFPPSDSLFSPTLLPCQKAAPTLPTMQLDLCQRFGLVSSLLSIATPQDFLRPAKRPWYTIPSLYILHGFFNRRYIVWTQFDKGGILNQCLRSVGLIWLSLLLLNWIKSTYIAAFDLSQTFVQRASNNSYSWCLHGVFIVMMSRVLEGRSCSSKTFSSLSFPLLTTYTYLHTHKWVYNLWVCGIRVGRSGLSSPWDQKLWHLEMKSFYLWDELTDGIKIEERAPEEEIICHSQG